MPLWLPIAAAATVRGEERVRKIGRRAMLGGAGALAASGFRRASHAQASFPVRQTKMIVPYPPGGPTDIMARVVADFVGRDMKQNCIVDNRGGANGSIGAEAAARSEPDGYTVLMIPGSVLTQNPSIYKKLTYDPPKDFRMLAVMTVVPIVIVAGPKLDVRSLKELVERAKAEPGKLVFGSAGIGGTTHLAGERFKVSAGIDITHVPYKGVGPSLNDLLGGHIDLMFDTLSTSIPHIKAGKLRAIALATPGRLTSLPDVPTAAESGYPDYVINVWFGVAGPRKMPDDIAKVWTDSLHRSMDDAEVRSKLEGINYVMMKPMDQLAQEAFVAEDREVWAKIIKAQGITVE